MGPFNNVKYYNDVIKHWLITSEELKKKKITSEELKTKHINGAFTLYFLSFKSYLLNFQFAILYLSLSLSLNINTHLSNAIIAS